MCLFGLTDWYVLFSNGYISSAILRWFDLCSLFYSASNDSVERSESHEEYSDSDGSEDTN